MRNVRTRSYLLIVSGAALALCAGAILLLLLLHAQKLGKTGQAGIQRAAAAPAPVSTGAPRSVVPGPVPSANPNVAQAILDAAEAQARLLNPPTPQHWPTATPTPVMPKGDFGSWRYSTEWTSFPCTQVAPCEGIFASITYDAGSVAALRAYVAANRNLASQLAARGGEAEVDITFRNYVPPDRFRNLARTLGLSVEQSEARYIDWQGRDDMMVVGTTSGDHGYDPLSQAEIDERLSALIWVNKPARTFPGVYFTRATLPANQLPALAADSLVYLAEVTPNVVRDALVAAGFRWKYVKELPIYVTPRTPFSQMEKLGLENFAK